MAKLSASEFVHITPRTEWPRFAWNRNSPMRFLPHHQIIFYHGILKHRKSWDILNIALYTSSRYQKLIYRLIVAEEKHGPIRRGYGHDRCLSLRPVGVDDNFRSYSDIRRALCHQLGIAHNVWSGGAMGTACVYSPSTNNLFTNL